MIASVIVDVKVKNVNKPFSYYVPSYFESVIEKGMRVKVPFGSREIMGFVLDITEDTHYNDQLKPIIDILDITPTLTKELLDLALVMSKDTASFLISCIQVMLPAAIKAKYIKKLVKKQSIPTLDHYFNRNNECDFSKINKEDYHHVKKALNNNELELIYDIVDKHNVKYETYVKLTKEYELYLKNVSSKKQQAVIDYLLEHKEVKKSELIKDLTLSDSTFKLLIDKGLIEALSEEVYREHYQIDVKNKATLQLTEEQEVAYREIKKSIDEKQNEIFLLHGVTGSGKTEVYLRIISDVIEKGLEAILLVPEISLTPQIVRIFKERFGEKVAVLHSGLSIGEKYDEWRKIRKKEVSVVVGARSAIFAPLENIGVIIIDEEHEDTYKQGEMPKYHAIEIAKKRVDYHQSTLVLGSATPSLESYARAVKKVYRLLELTKRATNMGLPETHIVDMTAEFKQGNLSIISKALYDAIVKRLENKEQIILLLNRRGYENFLLCRECGTSVMCPNCDITLTFHKSNEQLKCHYCGFHQSMLSTCPNCHSKHLRGFGFGTQKVEEELYRLFPESRVLRMDNDTTSNKGDHEKIIEAFREKKADILLGTQMIAKGLDFIDVTLVGVISADTTLKLPDYKASEKTFQLITQVSGRAGRHKENSEVYIQSYNSDHYAIVLAAGNNYKAFFNHEMKIRKLGKYVPYYYLSQIVVSDEIFQEALKGANRIVEYLKAKLTEEAIILGPLVPQVKRINNIYSSQIIIKYKNETNLKQTLEEILVSFNEKKVNVVIDMYPTFLL